jgi:hypothetical protein
MTAKIDLTGRQIHWLTVLYENGKNKHGQILYRCECECGELLDVSGNRLRGNKNKPPQKSCGKCGKNEGNTRHGMCESAEYTIYCGIKARCYNPKHVSYKYYGAIGITMDDHWLGKNGFENFYRDMGPKPSEDRYFYSIERIDRKLPYSKENCKWATYDEQNQNSSHNVVNKEIVQEIRLKWETNKFSVLVLSQEYDISESTIRSIVNNKTWIDV